MHRLGAPLDSVLWGIVGQGEKLSLHRRGNKVKESHGRGGSLATFSTLINNLVENTYTSMRVKLNFSL